MQSESPPLRPATAEELQAALASALAAQRRREPHAVDDLMAWLAAGKLVDHLARHSGLVVMTAREAAEPGPE